MPRTMLVDHALATTRTVRKRLDTTRPVRRALIEECLHLAVQAPNGGNLNSWRWIVVDDRAMVRRLGDIYLGALADVKAGPGTDYRNERGKRPGEDKMAEAVDHLAHTMGEMPALLVPLMKGRPEGKSLFLQANMYGSVLQAVWSFFLALRARGLGSAWTTLSLLREAEMAEALGIPIAEYTQVGLFPIAYTIGTEFKPAYRDPLDTMLRYNAFS